jgi:hypothetical protein
MPQFWVTVKKLLSFDKCPLFGIGEKLLSFGSWDWYQCVISSRTTRTSIAFGVTVTHSQ